TRRERQREIPAPEQRAEPRRGSVWITIRRRILKRPLPHSEQVFNEWLMRVRVSAESAQTTDDVVKRAFEFQAARGFEFIRSEHGSHERFDVAIGARED